MKQLKNYEQRNLFYFIYDFNKYNFIFMHDKIEYLTRVLSCWIEPELKKIGEEGWELVCILPISGNNDKFIFKRKKL